MKTVLFLFIAMTSLLGFGVAAQAEATIKTIDVSEIEGLEQAGEAYKRLSTQDFYSFKGIDHPIVFVNKANGRWYWHEDKLKKWDQNFPLVSFLTASIELSDGTLLSGKTPNHLRYIKRPTNTQFEQLPALQDLYWTNHIAGSDIVLAKRTRNGPLLVLKNEQLLAAPFPELGKTRKGEFLPWYSRKLDGLITSYLGKLWFLKIGTQDWRKIVENPKKPGTGSRAPNWGVYQKNAKEVLSVTRDRLYVIKKNGTILDRYIVEDGYPMQKLRSFHGGWHILDGSDDIFGWNGKWDNRIFEDNEISEILSNRPELARLSSTSQAPQVFEGYEPKILLQNENKISYQYEFETMPGTNRMYFLHSEGFAFYADGQVTALPKHWLSIVGDVPKFLKSHNALYVASDNGIFHITKDGRLVQLLKAKKPHLSLHAKIFTTSCETKSIGFFGWRAGIYTMHSDGSAKLIYQSPSPVKIYGTSSAGDAVLFAEKEGQLKSVNVTCE